MRRESVVLSPSKSWLASTAVLPSFIFLGYASWRVWGYMLDDAYISLEYAKNLAEGRGLVFNPGEGVEGFSNPLWVFLLFALGVAGAPWVFTMKALGFLCATLTLGILASTINGLVRRTPSNSGRKRAKAKGKRRPRKQKSAKDPNDNLAGDQELFTHGQSAEDLCPVRTAEGGRLDCSPRVFPAGE